MKKILGLVIGLGCTIGCLGQAQVGFNINVNQGRKPINPDIYGTNTYKAVGKDTLNPTVSRFGGNRSSAYNWENNFSNAGSDYIFSSDDWWLDAVGINKNTWKTVSGSPVQALVDSAGKTKRSSMITLQAMGYVSADGNGAVACNAPCNRWIPAYANKPGGNYQYPPDKTDNAVYLDEEVSWLVNKYGKASSGGIKYYQIDNEPELWNSTHSKIRTKLVTPVELAQINETFGKMIRIIDPSASIMGFVAFGWYGLVTVDLKTYLKEMKIRSTAYGSPLIDIFDWHFYPNDLLNYTANKEWDLLQAPRILWDSKYFIQGGAGPMGYYGNAPQLMKRYKGIINTEFPGLKMGITEWNSSYDETKVVSGLYVADILGVYGQEDIEVATYFTRPTAYAATGFKLFRNYDGKNSTYGDTYVQAISSDVPNATVYASTESKTNDDRIHIIAVSKNMTSTTNGTFTVSGTKSYIKAEVYYFDPTSQKIKKGQDITGITGNAFQYNLPNHSAVHFVLTTSTVTGLEDERYDDKINLFPQPFEKDFRIEAGKEFIATIYSLDGVKISNGIYQNEAFLGNDLSKGTYLVKIEIDNQVYNKKVIKY
ncbi:MAG: T9SS type A sorting domain-containing protein [Opitutaceae bacterium]|nr:T9SS type A sorting domain-containing protein [Cytophagales bacterium]